MPTVTAEQSYTTSISRVRDAALRVRLGSIIGDIAAASDQFAAAATAGTIASISAADAVGPVTANELGDLYTQRFAQGSSAGRVIYDQLITSAPNGQCPLCGHRQVPTLDHFLPKRKHPALTVAPLNLLPACSDCNKLKLDESPTSQDTVTLHPYFDNVDTPEWLLAEVIETDPASVRFRVEPPPDWDPVLAARTRHHFKLFCLARLYAAQAAEEMLNIRFDLESVFQAGGSESVTAHLEQMAVSRAQAHPNSWQTAMYIALAASAWFCSGGFR